MKKTKMDRLKTQTDYKSTLDKQHFALEEQRRLNKMTKQEKALNSLDLQVILSIFEII